MSSSSQGSVLGQTDSNLSSYYSSVMLSFSSSSSSRNDFLSGVTKAYRQAQTDTPTLFSKDLMQVFRISYHLNR